MLSAILYYKIADIFLSKNTTHISFLPLFFFSVCVASGYLIRIHVHCGFFHLHRLKTWLRSIIDKERLNDLALLHIHKDITITIENIIFYALLKQKKDTCF